MILHHATEFPDFIAPRLPDDHKPAFRRILGVHVNGHDTSVAIVEDGIVIEVIEFERVFRKKHCRVNVLHPRFASVLNWFFEDYNVDPNFDAVAIHLHHYGSEPPVYFREVQKAAVDGLSAYVPDAHYVQLNHHLCHAASSYFTSPFDRASILSYDGHGNDGFTVAFKAEGNQLSYLRSWPFSMGRAYSALSNIIGGIGSFDGNSAGKVMGLTAYGNVIEDWLEPIKTFIRAYQGIRSEFSPLFWEASIADGMFHLPGFGTIESKGAFDGPESTVSQDFATTFQQAWTDISCDVVKSIIDDTGCPDICIVGGCALNAATNYSILRMQETERLHLIPHPNDDGLSVGAALYTYYAYQGKPWNGIEQSYFSPYLGTSVLDQDELPAIAAKRKSRFLDQPYSVLAEMVSRGKIIGVIQGQSELGPRALGNRSIICDPRAPDMKDKLNEKVKGREWYRPFAPVVQEENQMTYFDLDVPAPYMSYIGYTNPEWKDKLPSITHADGTARVQTVTQEQNPFLWQLLKAFEEETGVGVLLNTSFNGRGEPIVTRISEALAILDNTELDAVYSDGWLFE